MALQYNSMLRGSIHPIRTGMLILPSVQQCPRFRVNTEVAISNGESGVDLRYVAGPLTHKQIKNNGEVSQYFVENSHEAIISMDVFEAVQMRKGLKTPQ